MQTKCLLILGLLVAHASSYQIFVKVQSIRFVANVEGKPPKRVNFVVDVEWQRGEESLVLEERDGGAPPKEEEEEEAWRFREPPPPSSAERFEPHITVAESNDNVLTLPIAPLRLHSRSTPS